MVSIGNGAPEVDDQQDLEAWFRDLPSGQLEVKLRRQLDTGDFKNDYVLPIEKEFDLGWAVHTSSSDITEYHTNRGAVSLIIAAKVAIEGDEIGEDDDVEWEQQDADAIEKKVEAEERATIVSGELPDYFKRFNYYYFLSTLNPSQGSLTYTMTGILATTMLVLEHFRWRSDAKFYDHGKHAGGLNYWKIANFNSMYAGTAIMGFATLTQLLALFDIGVSANIMVWHYGVGLAGTVMSLISQSLLFMAYDSAYSDLKSSDATTRTQAKTVFDGAYNDMLAHGAFNLCVSVPLFVQYWNWMAAQWFSLDPFIRDTWSEEVDEEFWDAQMTSR